MLKETFIAAYASEIERKAQSDSDYRPADITVIGNCGNTTFAAIGARQLAEKMTEAIIRNNACSSELMMRAAKKCGILKGGVSAIRAALLENTSTEKGV